MHEANPTNRLKLCMFRPLQSRGPHSNLGSLVVLEVNHVQLR